MNVIYCYYIIDAAYLCEFLSVSESRGVQVEYLELSPTMSKQQFMTHSQYFVYPVLSVNDSDWLEWLSTGNSNHFKYMKLLLYS